MSRSINGVFYSYDVEEPTIEFKASKNKEKYYESEEPGVYINHSNDDNESDEMYRVTNERSMNSIYKDPITYIISRYAKYGADLFSLMTDEEVSTYQNICYNQSYKESNQYAESKNASLFR